MTRTKYALLFTLMLFFAVSGFAQLGGILNYTDSSKVPAKRMAQQNEWMNNSPNQPFPAKPRDMWQLGVYGGMFLVDGDAPPLPGWNIGLQVRKSLGYVVSLRGQIGYGVAKTLDYRKNPNVGNATPLLQYHANLQGPGWYVHNSRTEAFMPALDALFSLNNIMFHKKQSKFNVYALVGISEVIYKTKLDALNGSALYNYASLSDAFFNRTRKDIRADMKNFFDGEYETIARINDRMPNFGDSDPEQWQLRHSFNAGVGLEYRLGAKVSLGAEFKYIMTPDDYIEGWHLNNNIALTPDKDQLVLTNLSLNFNLGSSAKRVAPLWWINPLGYSYSELNNPSHMKFPKPILDDSDNDGVTDQFDIEPNTPAGCPVDTKGKSRDTDGDGVPDCRDKELITPTTCQPVDADGVGKCPDPPCCDEIKPVAGCTIGSLPSIQFTSGVKISRDAELILASAAGQIKANPTCKICVVGHGGASKREQQLSWDRVESVINYLVEQQGISRDRFVFKYGEDGDANTVDLQDCSNEEGPNMVPAPHPQYRKTK